MNMKSALAGGVCVAIGAAFALTALATLNIGSATTMGPGYFPLMLAVCMVLTGIYIVAKAFFEARDNFRFDLAAVPWRGLVLLSAAPILLGFTIRGLGLAPSVFLTSMVAAYASSAQTLRLALGVSIGLSIFCAVVFGYLLKLPIPVIGPWLSF